MSSQLALFAQQADQDRAPDTRHPWQRIPAWGGRLTQWRCGTCGELATISDFTGDWLFLRPQLAKPPKGPWSYANESHGCERREWA